MMRSKPTIVLRQARSRLLLQDLIHYRAFLADLLFWLTVKAGVDGGGMPTAVNSVSTSGSGKVWGATPDAARLSAGQVSTRDRALASTPVHSWILLGVEGLGQGTARALAAEALGQQLTGWRSVARRSSAGARL